MKHVAIDLGGRESQICIRAADGTIVEELRYQTRLLPQLMKRWEPSRVIVETSAEAFAIADPALANRHEVRVVPATLVKQLGVGERGVKTDRRDARKLSEVSCRVDLPSVHVPSELSRRLKSLCGSREQLIECRTKLINNVRGWMRAQLWRLRSGATATFVERARAHAAASQQAMPEHIERMLPLIEAVTKEIRAADKQLEALTDEHPIAKLLMTVPGVGPVTAVRFLAAIDDPSRFRSAHAVQSYLGLTPGERSSSETQQRTSITKARPPEARRALVQAAWACLRSHHNDSMLTWARELANRKHKFVAVVALARKLAGVLFAIWRDGKPYRSSVAN